MFVYDFDEVERPDDEMINDDEALDEWYENWHNNYKLSLEKHHRDKKTPNVNLPPNKRSIVVGQK